MPLVIPADVRFAKNPVPMPAAAMQACIGLIEQIASAAPAAWGVYETVKRHFGNSSTSTSESWAHDDMDTAMRNVAANAAVFIDGLYSAIKAIEAKDIPTPPLTRLNDLLAEHSVGYVIDPPNLRRAVAITAPAGDESAETARSSTYVLGDRLGGGAYGEVFRVTRASAFGVFEFAMKVWA